MFELLRELGQHRHDTKQEPTRFVVGSWRHEFDSLTDVEQIRENLGVYPDKLLADAGYWDEDHVDFCEQRGIDPYIATGRLKRGETPPLIRGRPPKDLDAKGRMYRKLRTKRGREEYARRKVIPEPVFGQIRVGQGFQHFLLRGIDKAQAEWSLVCACHNLLKIFRVTGAILA